MTYLISSINIKYMDYKIFDPEQPSLNQISSLVQLLRNSQVSKMINVGDNAYELLKEKIKTIKYYRFILYLHFNKKYSDLANTLIKIGFNKISS